MAHDFKTSCRGKARHSTFAVEGEAQPLGGSAFRTLFPRSPTRKFPFFLCSWVLGSCWKDVTCWGYSDPTPIISLCNPSISTFLQQLSGSHCRIELEVTLDHECWVWAQVCVQPQEAEPITNLLKGSFKQKSERLSRVFHADMSTVIQASERQAFIHPLLHLLAKRTLSSGYVSATVEIPWNRTTAKWSRKQKHPTSGRERQVCLATLGHTGRA